jgi:hypothetical protein
VQQLTHPPLLFLSLLLSTPPQHLSLKLSCSSVALPMLLLLLLLCALLAAVYALSSCTALPGRSAAAQQRTQQRTNTVGHLKV